MPRRRKFIENPKQATTYRIVNCRTEDSYDEDAPKTIWIPKSDNVEPIPPTPPSKKADEIERLFPSKGPRPDWDPDVIAALDDDFDYSNPTNVLDDDFISMANALTLDDSECHDINVKFGGDDDAEDDDEDADSGHLFSDDDSLDEQTKALFKKAESLYSMTSAVTNCTESVKTFNERFEKILESYDDDNIGALDLEEIEGPFSDENEILEILSKEKPEEELSLGNYDKKLKDYILNYATTEPEEKYVEVVTKGKLEYDCESILSTNSNIYNHPAVIKVETRKKRDSVDSTKMPIIDFMGQNSNKREASGDSDAESEKSDDLNERCSAICSIRPKHETPEERRERKRLLKNARREQRKLKKETKIQFKNAKNVLTQDKISLQNNTAIKLL